MRGTSCWTCFSCIASIAYTLWSDWLHRHSNQVVAMVTPSGSISITSASGRPLTRGMRKLLSLDASRTLHLATAADGESDDTDPRSAHVCVISVKGILASAAGKLGHRGSTCMCCEFFQKGAGVCGQVALYRSPVKMAYSAGPWGRLVGTTWHPGQDRTGPGWNKSAPCPVDVTSAVRSAPGRDVIWLCAHHATWRPVDDMFYLS